MFRYDQTIKCGPHIHEEHNGKQDSMKTEIENYTGQLTRLVGHRTPILTNFGPISAILKPFLTEKEKHA